MHKMMAATASIAIGLLAITLCGCATQLAVHHGTTALNDQYQPKGGLCMVGDQGCLAMMTEPPRTCLIASGHCNDAGSVQMIDPNTGVIPEPQVQLRGPIVIDPK